MQNFLAFRVSPITPLRHSPLLAGANFKMGVGSLTEQLRPSDQRLFVLRSSGGGMCVKRMHELGGRQRI